MTSQRLLHYLIGSTDISKFATYPSSQSTKPEAFTRPDLKLSGDTWAFGTVVARKWRYSVVGKRFFANSTQCGDEIFHQIERTYLKLFRRRGLNINFELNKQVQVLDSISGKTEMPRCPSAQTAKLNSFEEPDVVCEGFVN